MNMQTEMDRLLFVEQRDGVAAAVAFAWQVVHQYRKSVLRSHKRGYGSSPLLGNVHHGSLPQYRRGFIESYVIAKRYIASKTNNMEGDK